METGFHYIASAWTAQKTPFPTAFLLLHVCLLLRNGSGIVAGLWSRCLATDMFAESFSTNSCLCWFHSSCFEQILHNIFPLNLHGVSLIGPLFDPVSPGFSVHGCCSHFLPDPAISTDCYRLLSYIRALVQEILFWCALNYNRYELKSAGFYGTYWSTVFIYVQIFCNFMTWLCSFLFLTPCCSWS
jgi:hypothetical protein